MRVFIAAFCHESSTFSPVPTSRRAFEEFDYYRPSGTEIEARALKLNGYGAFLRRALDHGDTPILSTYTFAQPSGPTARRDYESLRDEILNDLKAAGEVDAVLLFLHGAQMADGYDDCEGDVLARVRAFVGRDTFVGALLDLHANITDTMKDQADALVACRHYPHTDFNERAEHLYDLAKDSRAGKVTLTSHYRYIPMLGMYYTTAPQMEAVNAAALEIQSFDGIASVSLIHGFPWTDISDVGAGVLIIAENDQIDVDHYLDQLATAFFEARFETRDMRISVDEALDLAEATPTASAPIIIADAADNAGGGAPSDSTFILSRILERGLSGYAIGLIWDQVAVQMAFDLGEGAKFKFRIGGKAGPVSGDAVDLTAKVLKLQKDMSQDGIGYVHPIGNAALLEVDGNYVVICSTRGQVFSPSCFTDLGADLGRLKGVVVKSSQHFYDQFAPIGRDVVYVETPGALTLGFTEDMYQNVRRPIWPLDKIGAL